MQNTVNSTLIAVGFILATIVISIQGERIDHGESRLRRLEKISMKEAGQGRRETPKVKQAQDGRDWAESCPESYCGVAVQN